MRDSVLGCGSYVGPGSRVEGAVVLGCQVYQSAATRAALSAAGQATLGIGAWKQYMYCGSIIHVLNVLVERHGQHVESVNDHDNRA